MRLWRLGRGRLRPVVGCDGAIPPPVLADPTGPVTPTDPSRWVRPLPAAEGYWFELVDCASAEEVAHTLAPLLARLVDAERDTLALAKQLTARYEEIQLLYTISEILGRTIRLEQAAQTIVEEVSAVVGATRASIMVYDAAGGVLRPVAGVGPDVSRFGAVPIDDPESIAARVFRQARIIAYDPRAPDDAHVPAVGRTYRGSAFLSVPILYPRPGGPPTPIGVINFTDRFGTDAFSGGERRLVAAIASQIGAAIENSRLVARDLEQQRVRRELELAHDLQLKLLTTPALGADVDAAARCIPAESVGGDFYRFVQLTDGRVGVMVGDVSSHGFSAALIMALVLSAAGIHAEEGASPARTVRRLLESVEGDLADTEMHLTLFYGVIDPARARVRYTNAGLPHAFRLGPDGAAERLAATSPPLGLAEPDSIAERELPWRPGHDLLFLVSDGITDARNDEGARLGEDGVLRVAAAHRDQPTREIVDAVLEEAARYQAGPKDDRTIVALRV